MYLALNRAKISTEMGTLPADDGNVRLQADPYDGLPTDPE